MQFKKLTKALLIAVPAITLVACSSGTKSTTGEFAGYSADDLQVRYNTVYFDFDQYTIRSGFLPVLNGHAALLKAKSATIQIEGHADERGTPEYNIALGQRRANAVKTYLIDKGVKSDQLKTISYGEEKPAVLGHDEAAYSKNRRGVLVY